MTPRTRNLPQRQPKDSPAYQRWLAANEEGRRLGRKPVFDERVCKCGAEFTPKVGNQVWCSRVACPARTEAA
jgi:hypothetical protein